ncbi:MAG: ATP-binding protein [Clostridia bacterium]|nr:ATP-binding protein [Clostridia bacterium]
MFIGREKELKTLNRLYASAEFEFAVIYGRRRVGKTALIRQFIRDKHAIYFMGVESNAKQNLENFTQSILEFQSGMPVGASFVSFQAALEFVFQMAEKERIVLAIDEYPYAARSDKSLASTLQMLIDKYKETSRLMLILCGSSVSYMEDHVLAYKAPLYGRRTAQIRLKPFDFSEVCHYFRNLSIEDKALMYGIVGGTPQYLLKMSDRVSMEENIRSAFLDPSSALFEEPGNLLKQEVREPAVYNAIISAIANGYTKMSEISAKVGEETNTCAAYMKTLILLGLVKKELPYGEKTSRKSVYSIDDNMFRFWYRFIPANMSVIARGAEELAWKRIEPHLTNYMGRVFEEICRQYLWKLLLTEQCPVNFSSLGRWWGNDPILKKQAEIDIMGTEDKEKAIFGECKWTNEYVDANVVETLVHRAGLFSCSQKYLYIFAKRGFTAGCMEAAQKYTNLRLVTFDEMMKLLDT